MCRLRKTPPQAARDLYYLHAQLQVEASLVRQRMSNYVKRLAELFIVVRKPTRRCGLVDRYDVLTDVWDQHHQLPQLVQLHAGRRRRVGGAAHLFAFGAINFIFAFPAVLDRSVRPPQPAAASLPAEGRRTGGSGHVLLHPQRQQGAPRPSRVVHVPLRHLLLSWWRSCASPIARRCSRYRIARWAGASPWRASTSGARCSRSPSAAS